LLEVLLRVIVADKKVVDSELKFLQLVKTNLKVNDETLITKFPTHINHLINIEHLYSNISFKKNVELIDISSLDVNKED